MKVLGTHIAEEFISKTFDDFLCKHGATKWGGGASQSNYCENGIVHDSRPTPWP